MQQYTRKNLPYQKGFLINKVSKRPGSVTRVEALCIQELKGEN
jgi:hypothetical protein